MALRIEVYVIIFGIWWYVNQTSQIRQLSKDSQARKLIEV